MFLLESVDQGRLGRYSLVGCGDGSSRSRRPRRLNVPVVGYLVRPHREARAHRARFRRTGLRSPESRFIVADVFFGSTTSRLGGGARGRSERPWRACLLDRRSPRRGPVLAGETVTLPATRPSTSGASSCAKEHIRRGDIFQVVLSQRAVRERTSRRSPSTGRCGASTLRRISSCSSSAGWRSSAPRPRRT